ncbi:MAG TPA: hypothetical protein VJT85_06790 [Gemmatimonadaceae bacterium]|nr:hypothetical protein [Gemmatimonadaceae bacterium]
MKLREAQATLDQLLATAGLTDESLEPWHAWKVFKKFARMPVEDVVDDVTVQYGPQQADDGGRQVALYISREFSEPHLDGAELVCHVGCEFLFSADALAEAPEGEYWTQDYPSLERFIDAVESAEGFQLLMNANPLASSRFREEV